MANSNAAGVNQLSDKGPSGSSFGQSSTDLISFFGATPVVRQTAGAAAVAIDPTASGSALVASIHSIAISAASLANANRLALINLGLIG